MPVMNEEKMQKVEKGRKNIRVIKKVEDLSIETRVANIEEEERIKRVENLKKKVHILL